MNLIESADKAGKVESRTNKDGSTDVDVFVADIMGNGTRAKVIERVYGLERRGY
ncbi:MAG: hypothetical protein MZU84_03255 [Sphingobacterium sp.]|nr:hypothetical protein [Sphingobacterium sp.]